MNDASFNEKEKIKVNAYKAKKKENHSQAEKITQCKNERLRKQKYIFKKGKKQMSDNNNIEAATLINITNSYKTPQSLRKSIIRICEKLPNSPLKKQAVIKTLVKKSGIIHSEKLLPVIKYHSL